MEESKPVIEESKPLLEDLHCIKCKSRTGNTDIAQKVIQCKGKDRNRISAQCTTCGSKKGKYGSLDKIGEPKVDKPTPKPRQKKIKNTETYIKKSDLPPEFVSLLNLYRDKTLQNNV
jgi:hypothetical protein